MSEYRLAHVTLTCMAVFVVVESVMIALLREYGFTTEGSFFITPIPVDFVSFKVWLWMAGGVLLLREPICRSMFRTLDDAPREAFVPLYRVGVRLLGVALLLVFLPHLALLTQVELLDAGFAVSLAPEFELVLADAAVVIFAISLLSWSTRFARLAMWGSRRT